MFICGECKQNSQSGEKMTKVVIKARSVKYKDGLTGTEIVDEIGVCTKCKELK